MSLRARLLAFVALATLVPAALVGLRFVQNRTNEIEAAFINLSASANDIANDLDGKIQGTAQLLYGLARARDLDSRDKMACSAFLSAVREEYPQYTGILTIEPDGSLFCDSLQTGRTLDLTDRDYFRKALIANDAVVLEPVFGRLTGISVLQIASPARSESGHLKFVLLASLSLQSVADYHNERLSPVMAVLIVDKNGTVLVRPSGKAWFMGNDASIANTDLFKLATTQPDKRAGEVAGIDGRTQVWAVASSPAARDAGMYFMVGRSKDELVAVANRRLGEDMAILAAISLLLFAGVWMLAELGIRRQVGRLAAMATKLGHGDLSVRIPPPYPQDELGGLMTVLNGTAESLEHQRAAIGDLNQKLRQSQKMEALGQLTGGLAHDFNNLLTVILGNAEHLAERLSADPELRDFAEGAVSAAERGAELTKSLLAFSRQQPLMPKDIDVGQQILGMEIMLRRALGAHIECKFILGPDLWHASVDPGQLQSAVLNLALNARDATPNGGYLTVEIRNATIDQGYTEHNDDMRAGDFVMVAVTDTGTGMPRDVVARALEPFFTTKGVGKGTGLGLSMVYGFVKQSGGSMKIYSEPGHGTVVKLYLPRAGALQVRDEPVRARNAAPGGSESILVVEDDDMVRTYVERELKELGYHTILARDRAAALEILRQSEKIDLLFTDVVMPGGMFGPKLADEASRLRPGLKVLYTSGYTENAVLSHGRLDPAIKLLDKPYRRQDLAMMLRSVLNSAA
jgi:signal transduction histidine kinase/CheY-like chemotaxis protein